ncbi:helix-turn-helix transcriptional regulator [Sphingomonas soli]|uniref:helix-turn-helix transcriptional regulator n=1 Tax=Sphingomonas soli TaxID=266127 RepID=UPI00082CBE8C|nr:helix-turn-helix transcriptional regulator [Sphingomonas soli]
MIESEQHDAIVACLYAAAAGDRQWSNALELIAQAFRMSAAVMVVADPAGASFRAEVHGRPSDYANSYYASEIFLEDPRVPFFLATPPGKLYFDHCLYDVAAMARDDRVQRTTSEIGVFYQLGAQLRLPAAGTGTVSMLSTEAEGHASEEVIRSFRRLAPHIEQACAFGELIERNAATQDALIEALAARADGVILLDRIGRPVFVNDVARAILGAGDGLGFTADGLVTRRGPETRRLRGMIADILGKRAGGPRRPGGQILITRPSMRLPYVVRVLPAPASERFLALHSIACVIHIHDLAAVRLPSRRALRATFGLTERESDLAIELVRHAGLGPAAEAVGMALNTARNHLQGIFRKCGVASQAEAVQLLTRLA